MNSIYSIMNVRECAAFNYVAFYFGHKKTTVSAAVFNNDTTMCFVV